MGEYLSQIDHLPFYGVAVGDSHDAVLDVAVVDIGIEGVMQSAALVIKGNSCRCYGCLLGAQVTAPDLLKIEVVECGQTECIGK